MTEEQIKQNASIPTAEIEKDIKDTQKEIDAFNSELKVLQSNPVKNRLEIYLREGRILQRQEFIDNLNQILKYRKDNKE